MDFDSRNESRLPRSPVIETLVDGRRRRILAVLLDRTSPVTEEDLAAHLAATERGTSMPDPTDEATQSCRIELDHVHLPALEDAGLVVRNEAAGTVATTDHPVFEDPTFERLLRTEADGWDDVLANLADERRRTVLSVLEDRDAPVGTEDLARAVAARDGPADPETVADLRVSLSHVHLPKLADADLIGYDRDTGRAAYVGHPALPDEGLDVPVLETTQSVRTTPHDEVRLPELVDD